MRRYQQVSGVLFALIAAAQLTRSILGMHAQVGGLVIPVWFSIVAFLLTGSMAIWAFRGLRSAGR